MKERVFQERFSSKDQCVSAYLMQTIANRCSICAKSQRGVRTELENKSDFLIVLGGLSAEVGGDLYVRVVANHLVHQVRHRAKSLVVERTQKAFSVSTSFHVAPRAMSFLPLCLHPPLKSLLLHALKLGPKPAHIAFIMDGNRRYANSTQQPIKVAHQEGFNALKRILNFFLLLGVENVTVYAFSIENFNRDPNEVEILMEMARIRLLEICQQGSVCVSSIYRLPILILCSRCNIRTERY